MGRNLNPFHSRSPLNPVNIIRNPIRAVKRTVGLVMDPTGSQAKAARRARSQAEEAQARADIESAAFTASQKEARERLQREDSDRRRGNRRSGSRRSLLTGDERGVDDSGRRPVTG